MADEAQKEPTMEEILSSIRKIISEDDSSQSEREATAAPAQEVAVDNAVNDDFEDLTLDNVVEEADDSFGVELEEDIFEADTEFEEDTFEIEDELLEPVEVVTEAPPEPVFQEPAPEPQPEPQPVQIEKEPEMAAAAKIDTSGLTDSTTADAAAGALGQLFSKMDLSSENTIDGLVRELLKPMIKEWLDSNLQGIVEAKVEAEVARIARMAR